MIPQRTITKLTAGRTGHPYRRSSRFQTGQQTFVAFFCGIALFSLPNLIILKNDLVSRTELIVSERVVKIPNPTKVTYTKHSRSSRPIIIKSTETKLTRAAQDIVNTEKRSVVLKEQIDAMPINEKRGMTGDSHHDISKLHVSNKELQKRPDALTLAKESMKMMNISIGVEKQPFTAPHTMRNHQNRNSGRRKENIWYDDKALFENVSMPGDFTLNYPMVDPLNKRFNSTTLRRIVFRREVPHLGVLLDAGRHYFNVKWIHRMIDVLAALNYNLLHFRLTDDQSFNVLLESQPLLAYPSTLHNNTRVYSTNELRNVVKYAKSKGIQVIPEINVPGHAGSWGGIPDLIVQCPKFICGKGYGVPLNVSNPKLFPILKDVLSEIVDIFDRPPYLHLGGDEVDMAGSCFEEIGEDPFSYDAFEMMLGEIVREIGYNESQIVRWETTGSIDRTDSQRTGKITHFWYEHPGKSPIWRKRYGANFSSPVFLSSGLYFDTNIDDSAWEIYVKTKQLKHILHERSPVLAIIAGTFELDSKFWLDRNVVGRLLAVSMGISSLNTTNPTELFGLYKDSCSSAGFNVDLCALYGRPPMPYTSFRNELKDGKKPNVMWRQWKTDICERLTYHVPTRQYKPRPVKVKNSVEEAKKTFWMSLYNDRSWQGAKNILHNSQGKEKSDIFPLFDKANRIVNHTGIVFDIASHPISYPRLNNLISEVVRPLGLNMVQLRLVDDTSFAYHSVSNPQFFYANPHAENIKYPSTAALNYVSKTAGAHGIAIMPEIAISTNAGGWYQSNFNVKCGEFLCEYGRYIPQDVNNPEYLPTIFGMIRELLQFTSTPFIHLGHDDREKSMPCFHEVDVNRRRPKFDEFEESLGRLLDFIGVTNDRVVRWENNEKVLYPSRIGHITQYPADAFMEENATREGQLWIGTVDVRRGGPWQVYSTTRRMAAKSPLAVIAQIGEMGEYEIGRDNIEHRLIAFRMGLSDKPIMSQSEFLQEYPNICSDYFEFQSTSMEEDMISRFQALCKAFAANVNDAPSLSEYNEAEFWKNSANKMCEERTRQSFKLLFKNETDIPTAISMR
ncbi:beta-N-acetylhexosaminidase [Nitzschia inconspicua]|uniref:Beta-N-acetylhexosaminidase n=1 Tax=Nitzschia inconspicua TaxID=303405 RepID=A0A9K3LP29_9STRA|nr:beta-N-acetylhexosaminidase [Nitzschia inconspicua]